MDAAAIEAESSPTSAAARGSALIVDDSFGFPAAVINPSTGELLRFVHPLPAGEAGDTLASGVMAIEEFADPSVKLFDADFNPIATVSINTQTTAGSIRANRTLNKFFAVSKAANPDEVKAIGPDGTVSATYPITDVNNIRAIAVSNDQSILHFSHTGNIAAIFRWDLVGGSVLSDLVNLGTSTNIFDIIVLADDTVLALWSNGAGSVRARRYNAGGLAQYLRVQSRCDPGLSSRHAAAHCRRSRSGAVYVDDASRRRHHAPAYSSHE
jgi:hypothetical protein